MPFGFCCPVEFKLVGLRDYFRLYILTMLPVHDMTITASKNNLGTAEVFHHSQTNDKACSTLPNHPLPSVI